MKFGKYVEDHAVPEWASQYLSYKQLKKSIKKIVNLPSDNIELEQEKVREFEETLKEEITKITSFYILKESEAADFYKRLQQYAETHQISPKQTHKEHDEHPLLQETEILKEIELNDIPISPSLPPSPSLSPSSSSAILDNNFNNDNDNDDAAIILSTNNNKNNKKNNSDNKNNNRKKTTNTKEEKELKHEKFALFLHEKFLRGFHYSENVLNGISSSIKNSKWNKASPEEKAKAKKKLAMTAALEYYRGLVLLKNYAIINYTGFIKILKKADKLTKFHFREEMMSHVNAQPFRASDAVDRLMAGTEKLFGKTFFSGDIRQAKRILRVPGDQKADPTRSFIAGTFLGLNLLLAALLLYTIITNSIDYHPYDKYPKFKLPRMRSVYTMFSALGLPILWLWVFGIDIVAWSKSRINYSFIFDMDPRWKLSHSNIFEVVTSMTFMWLVAIGLDGRFWFLNTLKRIATAPLKSVKFKDFFIADQLTSLVLVLVQFQYLICFYVTDVWHSSEDDVCFAQQPKISPFLSALPAFWRFMQCFRRYRDSKDRIHLLNAGKYSCTFFVVLFSALDSAYGGHPWNKFRICWIIAATVNSTYAYCWDIFMDWSILYYKQGKFSIRKKRSYPWSALYIWAACSNLILRFTWSLTKSNLVQLSTIVQWKFVVLVAAAEIFRRGQWNLFRMENEHLNNCGKFRAVQELQLPV